MHIQSGLKAKLIREAIVEFKIAAPTPYIGVGGTFLVARLYGNFEKRDRFENNGSVPASIIHTKRYRTIFFWSLRPSHVEFTYSITPDR